MRLVVFDATDVGVRFARAREHSVGGTSGARVGLTPVWMAGADLHRRLGAADATLGARSWDEALAWASDVAAQRDRPIRSLQFWGHGGWGVMWLGGDRFDASSLMRGHPLSPRLDALRARLAGPDALVWFRCCSAFGHTAGRAFAAAAADRLGARAAGHTYIIGFFQSGTHALGPGEKPEWDPGEGVRWQEGQAAGALHSSPSAPNTVTCLRPNLPPHLARGARGG